MPHLAGKDVTGSAYCTARGRLPLAVLQTLLARCTAKMTECVRETGLWLGHRLFVLDGSSFSMPDTDQLREHFGQPGGQAAGCGFPTAHWLALVHFGLVTDVREHLRRFRESLDRWSGWVRDGRTEDDFVGAVTADAGGDAESYSVVFNFAMSYAGLKRYYDKR